MSENLKRAESLFNRIMNQSSSQNRQDNAALPLSKGTNGSMSENSFEGNTTNNYQGSNSNPNNYGHNLNGQNNNHRQYKNYRNHNYSGSNNLYSQHVDFPRVDPIKVAQETLANTPPNHHILPYCWTFWYHFRNSTKSKELLETTDENNSEDSSSTVNNYLQTTNEVSFNGFEGQHSIKNIASLEQFWASIASIKKGYDLPIGTEFLIFKSGVSPVWEDPINTKGGRWVFRFSRRLNPSSGSVESDNSIKSRYRTTLIWERLLLRILTGSFISAEDYSEDIQDLFLNDISGVVLSVRKDEDILSIWNSNINFGKRRHTPEVQDDSKRNTTRKLTPFQARRIICDSILRVIRESDLILQGQNPISTIDSGSNERVFGVSFEYRLHADNNGPSGSNYNDQKQNRRYHKPHHQSYNKEMDA